MKIIREEPSVNIDLLLESRRAQGTLTASGVLIIFNYWVIMTVNVAEQKRCSGMSFAVIRILEVPAGVTRTH
jgi:hypothetical protein